jgi:copper chaperone CopZ
MSNDVERVRDGESRSWRVGGMDCPSCVAKIEKAVSRLPGVQDVSVNLMAETLTAQLDRSGDPAVIARTVEDLGYKLAPQAGAGSPGSRPDAHEADGGHDRKGYPHTPGDKDEEPDVPWWRTGKARFVLLLGGLVGAAFLLSYVFSREAYWIYLAATLIAYCAVAIWTPRHRAGTSGQPVLDRNADVRGRARRRADRRCLRSGGRSPAVRDRRTFGEHRSWPSQGGYSRTRLRDPANRPTRVCLRY